MSTDTALQREEQPGSFEALFDKPLRYLVAFSKRLKALHSIQFLAIETENANLNRAISIIESIDVASWKILDEQQNLEASENIKKTLKVEITIEGLQEPLLGVPHRKFMKEGSIRLSKKNQHYQVFLFTDVIVFAEKIVNSQNFKLIRKVYASDLSVEETGTKVTLKISQGLGKAPIVEVLSFKSSKSERNEWIQHFKLFVERYKHNCVYGTPLEVIVEREQIREKIPFVLLVCIKYILAYGQTTEGLFRVPGETSQVETFQRIFDYGATEVDFRGCSVHDVATLLKLSLRMLPNPLIPFATYPELIRVQTKFESENDEKSYFLAVATIIKDMTPTNRIVLKYLLHFLGTFSQHSKHTKMTTDNLALVIAPNVVRPELDTVDTAVQLPIVARIFEFCISNHIELWEKAATMNKEIFAESFIQPWTYTEQKTPFMKAESRYSMPDFDPTEADTPTERSEASSSQPKQPAEVSQEKNVSKQNDLARTTPKKSPAHLETWKKLSGST